MIETISINDSQEWDNLVRSFPNHDVYYLSGYTKAFQIHGDGEPILIHFNADGYDAICVMMKRDIACEPKLKSADIAEGTLFDLVTPYGYGGFIFNKQSVPTEITQILAEELRTFLNENDIISAFFRFHPVLDNSRLHTNLLDVIDLGKTISFDLSSADIIWQNITSKNRNMIRKAEKQGVTIYRGKGYDLLLKFKEIYNETMRHDNAEEYYYFGDKFYESLDKDLKDNYEVFYAVYDDKIIAMSIMIFAGKCMSYHLSGSKFEYRNLAPSNLLLYKAALWGCENGYETLHLGGGVGSGEDNLYKFKAAFNRNSDYQFSIGKLILNQEKYDELVNLRGFSEEEKQSVSFFPVYRAEITR